MRPVQWSRDALDDIKAQLSYIAADNPAAAYKVAARLRESGARLGEVSTGRPGRVPGTFEKTVTGLPYIVAYQIDTSPAEGIVSILRVIHTSRDWPAGRWPRQT